MSPKCSCLFITANITTLSLSLLYNDLPDNFPGCRHQALLPHLVRLLETEAELLSLLGWLGRLAGLKTEMMQWGARVVKSQATCNTNINNTLSWAGLGWAPLS